MSIEIRLTACPGGFELVEIVLKPGSKVPNLASEYLQGLLDRQRAEPAEAFAFEDFQQSALVAVMRKGETNRVSDSTESATFGKLESPVLLASRVPVIQPRSQPLPKLW